MKKIILFLLISTLISCSSNKKNEKENISSKALVKHAKRFDIERVNSYYKLTIKNPYKGAKEHFDFILIPKGTDVSSIKESGIRIQIPIKKVIATSTTHIPMIESLGEENSLVGFPNTHYISSVKTRKLIDQGKIKDVGVDIDLNTELILDLNPDLIIGFSVNSRNKSLESLKRLGINVIYNGAWLEETPLGRAEWIKFFGILYDKEKKANSLFQKIESDYNNFKAIASKATTQPTVLSGSMFKDIWYVPAGESFVAHFLKDANTNYLWKDSKGTGSLQLNFESVLDKAQTADLWIGSGSFASKEELINSNPLYQKFNTYKTNNIYTFSNTKGATGGTVYYELGALRPDLILKDIIKIAHPNLLTKYDFTFFEKLKKYKKMPVKIITFEN